MRQIVPILQMRKLKQWVKWLTKSHTASKCQCPYSLQCYSHGYSMVLVQIQTHRSTQQNRKPRNKPRHLWSINLWQRRQEYMIEKRWSLQFSLSGWKIFWNHTFGPGMEVGLSLESNWEQMLSPRQVCESVGLDLWQKEIYWVPWCWSSLVVVVQSLNFSNSLWPHGLQHARLLSFTISQSLLKFMSIELVIPCNHLILCYPLLLWPSILPSISIFSNESLHQVAKVLELQLQHQSFQ